MPATTRRKVGLRVAHQKDCPNRTSSALSSVGRGSGCKCKPSPSFFTMHRDELGRQVKGTRVYDRNLAEREQTRIQAELDADRLDMRQPDDSTFSEWADRFIDRLRGRERRESTALAYLSTLTIAKNDAGFGSRLLRSIGQADLDRFVIVARGRGATDATLAKHLRHLGSVFQAAVDYDLIPANPVPRFRKALNLKVPKGTTPYTDAELAKLFVKLSAEEPVYSALCKTALTTGARQGELIAATWADLDLTRGVLHISKSRDPRTGILGGTKDHEPRDVHLIPPARKLLEDWTATVGVRPDDEPIFKAPRGNHLNGIYVTKLLKQAVVAAGIPTTDKDGRPRRPFHAFRATYTRLCLESGRPPQWVQHELGHATQDLTLNVYGEWSEDAIQAEAARAITFPDMSARPV